MSVDLLSCQFFPVVVATSRVCETSERGLAPRSSRNRDVCCEIVDPDPRNLSPALTRSSIVQCKQQEGVSNMGDRMQRLKGKVNKAAGRTEADAGYRSGSARTELKGNVKTLKGETQEAVGKARSKAKKATR
jgi:uncharacterized protein YjbJ (UPF0337 family)